ncbi:MAG: hypothetical protein UW03_C0018G0026, partial [Candidatus Peregrinibacteria bacterium GW2011_GWA2_43_8]
QIKNSNHRLPARSRRRDNVIHAIPVDIGNGRRHTSPEIFLVCEKLRNKAEIAIEDADMRPARKRMEYN